MISLGIARRFGNPIDWCIREPSLADMLSDSIVMAMMKADGVDPVALEAELRGLAQRSRPTIHAPSFQAPDPCLAGRNRFIAPSTPPSA